MTNWTITRDYMFCAAHRLEGHPKCGRLHGHNYGISVVLMTDILDAHDRWVLDYAQLDAIVKPIIDELDHRYLVSDENVNLECPYYKNAIEGDTVVLPIVRSTAEELAHYLVEQVIKSLELMGLGSIQVTVSVSETPKSRATYDDWLVWFQS